MQVEMTRAEAELLIALLTAAEGAFAVTDRQLLVALQDLREWRSALLSRPCDICGKDDPHQSRGLCAIHRQQANAQAKS